MCSAVQLLERGNIKYGFPESKRFDMNVFVSFTLRNKTSELVDKCSLFIWEKGHFHHQAYGTNSHRGAFQNEVTYKGRGRGT